MIQWDKKTNLFLLTPEEFERIPDGTTLTCIDNSTAIKGVDKIDDDARFGHMAYGITDPWNHELKNLFLLFTLAE